jgi:hypothetical protein
MLEGVLGHLACSIVGHEASFSLANFVGQAKMFLHEKEN